MNYLNKVQCKMMVLMIALIMAPQLSAQSAKSIFTKIEGSRSPIIQTEKWNYVPGEIVEIAGVDFQSYERVRLSVRYYDLNFKQEISLATWDVYADPKGRIFDEWAVFDVGQSGNRFIIKALGTYSGASSKTEISTEPLAGEAVNLTQCANTSASPQNLDCPDVAAAGWVSGNVGTSKARYFEGDSIAYRNVLTGLNVGKSYKWTVKYDTTKSGSNAIDQLTTYNRTITNANPCRNGAVLNAFCTYAGPTSTGAIQPDIRVSSGRDQTAATSDDITEIGGVITAWGATITAVSTPVYTGTFPGGDSTASVDITFTANTATAVIAWGGHIATRSDWGQAFGAVTIGGSPYHTENGGLMNLTDNTSCCTGSQALSLQAAAVTQSGKITIIKQASPFSTYSFGFTTTNLTPSTFNLVDNDGGTNPSQVFDPINTFNVKRITETTFMPYTLASITCGVVGTGGTPPPVVTLGGGFVDIDIKPGDHVTCTFLNTITTAAAVSVSGRVFDSGGNGLPGAFVTVTDAGGNPRTSRTNQFGYYRVDNIEAGSNLLFNVSHKGYSFPAQLINVDESLTNVNFSPQ